MRGNRSPDDRVCNLEPPGGGDGIERNSVSRDVLMANAFILASFIILLSWKEYLINVFTVREAVVHSNSSAGN